MEREHLLIGDPQFVAEKILRLKRDYNLEYLLTFMGLPGMDHQDVMRSIQLFAERVMPLIEEKESVAG